MMQKFLFYKETPYVIEAIACKRDKHQADQKFRAILAVFIF